jgi:hypothetical protein
MKNWLSEFWCKTMHQQAMWPIHGKYICPQCLREYPLNWEGPARASEYAPSLRKAELAVATTPAFASVVQRTVSTTL